MARPTPGCGRSKHEESRFDSFHSIRCRVEITVSLELLWLSTYFLRDCTESVEEQRSHNSGYKNSGFFICHGTKASDQLNYERVVSDRRSCNFFAGVLCDEHVKPGEVIIQTLGPCLCYCHGSLKF